MILDKNATKEFRKAFAQAVVDGWHNRDFMGDVVRRAYRIANIDIRESSTWLKDAASAINVRWIDRTDKVETWIPRNLRKLNNALWDGRNTETCVEICYASIGGVARRKENFKIAFRERDSRLDWKTVK